MKGRSRLRGPSRPPLGSCWGFRWVFLGQLKPTVAVWADPALDQTQIAWAQAVRDRLAPLSRGGYLNYATDDSSDIVAGAFGAESSRDSRP